MGDEGKLKRRATVQAIERSAFLCVDDMVRFACHKSGVDVLLSPDGGDVRDCENIWEATKTYCSRSGSAAFSCGTYLDARGLSNGARVYAFDRRNLRVWWRRRKTELRILKAARLLANDDLVAVAELLAERAGEPTINAHCRTEWTIQQCVRNVDVPFLEVLAAMLSEPSEQSRAAA